MGSKLKWVSRTITAILTYLLASAQGGNLLFFEYIFTRYVHVFIFDHLLVILFFLIAIYIVSELFISQRNSNKTLEAQCHNICRYIYKKIEEIIAPDFAHSIHCCPV